MLYNALLTALGLALLLVLVVTVRTVQFRGKQVEASRVTDLVVDEDAPKRLSGAVQIPTITKRDASELDGDAYDALFEHLETSFPKLHATLDAEPVNTYSRLFTWEGSDPSLRPLVLMAHVDVVPVEEQTRDEWTHPPFSGALDDGFVWGRGALDDKASAVGILEAVETLLREGMTPRRTVYLAIGHDEEVGGTNGASAIASRLADRGVEPAMVVDEGGAITIGAIPDFDTPLALVGIAEKGYLSVEITAEAQGGHSSVPPSQTSIGVAAEAVQRLRDNPLPPTLDGVTGRTFEYVAPEMGGAARVAFANRWLLDPAITWQLSQEPVTDAAIRTTVAPTILDAGVKDNVIPSEARAVINFRIVPSQSVDRVLEHVRGTLSDLPVTLRTIQEGEPTPVSDTDGPAFALLQQTIREVAPDVVVAPFLVPGTTDSRYYGPLSDNVFRFAPFRLTRDDQARIHGIDERISVEDYTTMVRFYAQVIRNVDAADDV